MIQLHRRRFRLESLERREMFTAPQPPLITDAAPYSAAFTNGVFRDTLGRSADPGALAWFTQQLDAGQPTGTVAAGVMNSSEFAANLVESAYRQYLGRDPEPAAIACWVDALHTRARDEQLTAALVASDEFYAQSGGTDPAWIAAAYQAVLGRAASGADLQWATGSLNSGVSRGVLASDLAYSVEHEQEVVTAEYARYLQAAPSGAEVQSWAAQLATGQQTAESLAVELTSTDAYYQLQTGVPLTVVPVPLVAIPTWAAINAQIENNAAHSTPGVVFLGDSITQGWELDGASVWQQEFASFDALDAGIGGDKTQSLLWRIENGDLNGISPQVAVVMIGINNIIAGDDATSVAEGIAAVVDELHVRLPSTKILLLGVLPAQPAISFDTMPVITQVDKMISGLANGQSINFADMSPSFTNSDGTIDTALYQPDLVHLNAVGYQTWGAVMAYELSALISPPPPTIAYEPGVQMASSVFSPVPWWPS